MLCDIANAYPNNNCLDASKTGGNMFGYTFYGDYSAGADFFIYDAITNRLQTWDNGDESRKGTRIGVYNGEGVNVVFSENEPIANGREYLWKAVVYEKIIDINNGDYPTILMSNGETITNPFVYTSVSTRIDNSNYTVGTGLTVTLPCYMVYDHEYREVASYNSSDGKLVLKVPFNQNVGSGSAICISRYDCTSYPASNATYITIPTGNTVIKDTEYIPNPTYPNVKEKCCYVKIGNEYRGISDYDSKLGVIYLESAFTNTVTSGTDYEVFCNYIVSPFYYFKTEAVPTISCSVEYVGARIELQATLSAETAVKYYKWKVYKGNNLIEESANIYSGRLNYWFRLAEGGEDYTAYITVVTQDDVTITSSALTLNINDSGEAVTNVIAEVDKTKNAVVLTWENSVTDAFCIIYRIDTTTNEVKFLAQTDKNAETFTDCTAAQNRSYTYYICPKKQQYLYTTATKAVENIKYNGWTMYFVSETSQSFEAGVTVRPYYSYMHNDKQYSVNSTWHLDIDVNGAEITHNINHSVYDTLSGKPVSIYGNNNYDSFTLTFSLGEISCSSDMGISNFGFDNYTQLRNLIAEKRPVVIKDIVGNVWFGTITEQTSTVEVGGKNFFSISLGFTQTRDMKNTRILTD